jgi:hypothetical protein
MRIELRETGSLADLDRRVVATDDRLTVSEGSQTVVTIDTLAVAVRPDPSDEQPPLEFWRLVRALHRLASRDTTMVSD